MTAERGTKRRYKKCASHFYDLNRDNFDCPKCDTSYSKNDFLISLAAPATRGRKKADKSKKEILENEEDIEDALDLDIDADVIDIEADLDETLDDDDAVVEGLERDAKEEDL